jgi:AcrR family transcriptional regulator
VSAEQPQSREPAPPQQGALPLPPGLDLLWGRRERGKRGPRPGLSADAIVGAAVQVADTEGIEAVSMARVAKELGFTTMSLYRHVASKDELLQLMWDASATGAEGVVLEGDGWRARLRFWAVVQRDMLDRHPWITQMPMAVPPLGPNSMHFAERGLAAFDGTGLPHADRMRMIGLISSYTLNEARMAHDAARAVKKAMEAGQPPGPLTMLNYEALLRELIDERTFPRLHRMAWSASPGQPQDERAEFLFGLDVILDGVQALINRTREASGLVGQQPVPGPVRDRQARRDVRVVRVGERHVADRPFHVGAQRRAELRVVRQPGVVRREHEAVDEPPPQVAHVAIAGVHVHQERLVRAILAAVRRGPAHDLRPVGGEPLHVQRVLVRVREGVIEFRVRQAPRVVRGGKFQERLLATGELIQGRPHGGQHSPGLHHDHAKAICPSPRQVLPLCPGGWRRP